MASITLESLDDLEVVTGACRECKNAVWQAYASSVVDKNIQFYPAYGVKLEGEKIQLACWCMVEHGFIASPLLVCDGTMDEEENEDGDLPEEEPE
ncbi:MAG: hypothetical protein IKO41_00300 [Lachnospiraceae bacterium]|nr:hypothetical protein [Lachnospiraceae bacterium]